MLDEKNSQARKNLGRVGEQIAEFQMLVSQKEEQFKKACDEEQVCVRGQRQRCEDRDRGVRT